MPSRWSAVVAFCAPLIVAIEAGSRFNGHRLSHDPKAPFEHVVSALPHTDPLVLAALPDSLDWRNVNGQDYMPSVKNQHQPGPKYCGACWAFATVNHLNARFNVFRDNAWPRSEVSVQVLISCSVDSGAGGCHGSDPNAALKFIHKYGLPHESCHTYQGESLVCDAYNLCQDCMAGYDPVCWARPKFPLFKVKEYGAMRPDGDLWAADPAERQRAIDGMVLKMKAEIFKRGPIVCQMASSPPPGVHPTIPYRTNESLPTYGGVRGYVTDYEPFFSMAGDNFDPFVLHDTTYECADRDWDSCVDHDVTVAGWGQENGTPYWLIQNSWGQWWGEGGYFRLIMGKNNLGIESLCTWGVPDLEGFDETKAGIRKFPQGNASSWEPRFEELRQAQARQGLSASREPVTIYA